MDLRHARLRSNPRFRLVPYDTLLLGERDALNPLNRDPDFFGILVPPPDGGLSSQSVSRDAALLFLALAQPACLPTLLASLLGERADERLRPLILDQVFEVEHEGRFVSGVAAMELLGEAPRSEGASRVAALSSQAITYAKALELLSVNELAVRLYGFNAAPSTPQLQRRLGSDDHVLSFLCTGAGTERRLQANWPTREIDDGWLTWSGADTVAAEFKLYISPLLHELPAVFPLAIRALEQAGCRRFKIGRGAYGLLRPDKMVAYFSGLDRLQRAAELIAIDATGAAAQGVPFSASIDAAGLLSWGMDPPRFDFVPTGQAQPSWRAWLSQRIAGCVIAARHCTDGTLQAFVRQRLALDGVDPASWVPNLAIWRSSPGAGIAAR